MKILGLWGVQWESQGHVLSDWVGVWSKAQARACVTTHKCRVDESVECTQSRRHRLSVWTEEQTSNEFSTWAFDVGSVWSVYNEPQGWGSTEREGGGWLELRVWRSGLASALSSYSCCFMSARFLGSKMVARSSVGEFSWCPWWDLTVRSMGEEDTPNRIYHGAHGDLVIPPLWVRPRSLAVSLQLINAKFVLLNTVLVTPSSCALYMMSKGHPTLIDLNMTSDPFSKHVTNARCYHWPREHIPPRTLLISQMDFMGWFWQIRLFTKFLPWLWFIRTAGKNQNQHIYISQKENIWVGVGKVSFL